MEDIDFAVPPQPVTQGMCQGSDAERGACQCSIAPEHPETAACSQPAPDHMADEMRPDGSPLDSEIAPSQTLAVLILSNGAQIEFAAVEEGDGHDGIAIRELCDAQRQMPSVLATMGRKTAAELYRALGPKLPVPRLISALAGETKSTKSVERVSDPLEVDLDELAILPPVQAAGSAAGGGYGAHFCVPGDGWHAFRDFACNFSGPSNTWSWCDVSAAYYYWQRSTYGNVKRKHSFGITATCGAPAETRHWYWGGAKWRRVKTWYLPNYYWQWTRYDGTIKRNRRVQHVSSIQGGSSFVRAFTAIYT